MQKQPRPSSRYHRLPALALSLLVACVFLAAAPASAQQVSVDDAATRILELEGQQRFLAQQRFMQLYRDSSDQFAGAYERASSVERRKLFVWALGEAGNDAACASLARIQVSASPDIDPTLAMAMANASARCGHFEPLRAILENGAAVMRAKAGVQLGLHGDQESRSTLEELVHGEQFSRYQVFFQLALGLLGDASQEELLTRLLQQVDARVYAAIALGRIGNESVAHDLTIALEDPEPLIREKAIEVLLMLRVDGSDDALREVLRDPDPRVRAKAEWALRRINRAPGE